MIPARGDRVKLFFRNGLVEEGVVLSWSDTKTVLRSLTSDNLLLVQNTVQDVIAVKLFVQEKQPQTAGNVYVDADTNIPERDIRLRAMKLAKLRILQGEEERRRAREAMTTFQNHGASNPFANYGIPNRLQKPPRFDPR